MEEPRDDDDSTVIDAHVILLMDSNRQFINPDMFWHGRISKKVMAGNVDDANKVINKFNFHEVKHAILHVGTNDVETKKSATNIANDINAAAVKLRDKSNAITYISTLPPRKDNLNNKCTQVNHHLRQSLPESIILIDNADIEVEDLKDKKHIKESAISKLVRNMKSTIRSALNISTDHNNHSNRNFNKKKNDSMRGANSHYW